MQYMRSGRKIVLIAIDTLILFSVYVCTFLLNLMARSSDQLVSFGTYILNFFAFLVLIMISRLGFRIYKNVWRYANTRAYLDVVIADMLGGAVATFATSLPAFIYDYYVFYIGAWECIAIVGLFDCATLCSRFIYQQIMKSFSRSLSSDRTNKVPVAIIGAGRAGALLCEELIYSKSSRYTPVFFVDNNKDKVGSRVAGIPVYSAEDDVITRIREEGIKEIIVAISSLDREELTSLYEYYSMTGATVKLYDFARGGDGRTPVGKRVVREFMIEDLLFRNTVKLSDGQTDSFYFGKTVLVTGGGGSIGSELCRQIALLSPKRLVIFDIYENNAYELEQELVRKYGTELSVSVEIGSVRDKDRLDAVFGYYRPDVVFHAAAHKHVPLMEHSCSEAIKNNVFGTYNTAEAAEKWGVSKFILISTDKAVNPTNVMGASKRMCEMIALCRSDSKTAFSAVRFGNVLGSAGSVIPLFKRQIAEGGPITVTDKRIIRYFMTIPEAAGLVMQAGAMAKCGELFVLDMGKPVKIYDLALNMIRLSGLVPGEDIEVVETGLRPGEKLYEELLIKTEELSKTENNLIFIEHDAPLSRETVEGKLKLLKEALTESAHELKSPKIVKAMREVVPTYRTPDEVNSLAQSSTEMREALTV